MTAATQFLTDLLDLATQTVTVTPKSSVNNYGEIQHAGQGTSYSAYVQKITASKRKEATDEPVVEFMAYIPSSTYAASVDDLLTYAGFTRPVVEVDIRSDEYGQQVVVLALGQPRRT